MADTAPPDAAFLEDLVHFARYVRANGSRATAPTGRLQSEVDRVAARTPNSSVIVALPDHELVVQHRSSPQAGDHQEERAGSFISVTGFEATGRTDSHHDAIRHGKSPVNPRVCPADLAGLSLSTAGAVALDGVSDQLSRHPFRAAGNSPR